jgi:hypothetical protein
MAIVISTGSDGLVIRHEVGTDGVAGSIPPCATAHDVNSKPKSVRNTGKLQSQSERCSACMAEYTSKEAKAGTFEFKYAGGKGRPAERKRVLEGISRLTPAERNTFVLSDFAKGLKITQKDVDRIFKAKPAPAAPAKAAGKGTGAKAPAAKSAKVADAVKRARTPRKSAAKAAAKVVAPKEEAVTA